jgi:hypothetical protein
MANTVLILMGCTSVILTGAEFFASTRASLLLVAIIQITAHTFTFLNLIEKLSRSVSRSGSGDQIGFL